MELLEQLEASALSQWLSISLAGFPTLIALHSVGMGIVVGLSLMICLRLNCVLSGIRAETIPRLLDVAIWGFTLNLVTGLAIFITRAPAYITSAVFLIKMMLVVVSAAILFWLRRRLRTISEATEAELVTGLVRQLSVFASLSWFGAVVTGRLIAYLSSIYR